MEQKQLEQKQFEQKQRTEILIEKMNYQLEKDSALIRAECDEKLFRITKHHMDKFNVSTKVNKS